MDMNNLSPRTRGSLVCFISVLIVYLPLLVYGLFIIPGISWESGGMGAGIIFGLVFGFFIFYLLFSIPFGFFCVYFFSKIKKHIGSSVFFVTLIYFIIDLIYILLFIAIRFNYIVIFILLPAIICSLIVFSIENYSKKNIVSIFFMSIFFIIIVVMVFFTNLSCRLFNINCLRQDCLGDRSWDYKKHRCMINVENCTYNEGCKKNINGRILCDRENKCVENVEKCLNWDDCSNNSNGRLICDVGICVENAYKCFSKYDCADNTNGMTVCDSYRKKCVEP